MIGNGWSMLSSVVLLSLVFPRALASSVWGKAERRSTMIRTKSPIISSLGLLSLALLLTITKPAWGGTLDRGGAVPGPFKITALVHVCPNIQVTQAKKGPGGDGAYLIEAQCKLPDALLPPFSIKAKAAFKWYGQWGDASESIEVIGPPGGTISSSVKRCDKDPFVSPPGALTCTGEKGFNLSGMQYNFLSFPVHPLLTGAVPANLFGTATQALSWPTPEPGVVRIVSPTQNQAIPISNGSFELKFEDNPAVKPDPDGAVKLEWQRFDSRSGWVSHPGPQRVSQPGPQRVSQPGPPTYVEYYKITQVVSIKDRFPNSGKYRVRALASPASPSHPWWTPWREFSIYHSIPVLPKAIKKMP